MSWAFKDSSLEVFANQEYHHKHADLQNDQKISLMVIS